MDLLGLRLIGAIALGVMVATIARRLVRPTPRLASRVRPYTAASRSLLGKTPDSAAILANEPVSAQGVVQRLYRPLVESVLGSLRRIFGAAFDDQALALKLRQADVLSDVPEQNRVHEYRIRQVGTALAWGIGIAVAAMVIKKSPPLTILGFGLGVILGATRGSAAMGSRIEKRRERMRIELYTVNQLLAIYLRTSGSPVVAAQRLVRRGRGAVIDDLDEALRLHARGMSASRAFNRIADHTPEPFASRTYKLLASGSERGADLAGALLSLSEDVRDHRRTELRRGATKRQGTMLIPIIMFLAPVMLLFIGAPIPTMVFGTGR